MTIFDQVRAYAGRKIAFLESIKDTPLGRGTLANMRRGIGRQPGDEPALWAMLFDGMPAELAGRGYTVSRAEWAVYEALVLYAMHPMQREKMSLGKAMGALSLKKSEGGDMAETITRRFNILATAQDIGELSWHLKGAVQLLRSEEIPLDYAALAGDLYLYQSPDARASVREKWGRDYYNQKANEENKEDETHDD